MKRQIMKAMGELASVIWEAITIGIGLAVGIICFIGVITLAAKLLP